MQSKNLVFYLNQIKVAFQDLSSTKQSSRNEESEELWGKRLFWLFVQSSELRRSSSNVDSKMLLIRLINACYVLIYSDTITSLIGLVWLKGQLSHDRSRGHGFDPSLPPILFCSRNPVYSKSLRYEHMTLLCHSTTRANTDTLTKPTSWHYKWRADIVSLSFNSRWPSCATVWCMSWDYNAPLFICNRN